MAAPFSFAMAQILVEMGRPARNLDRAVHAIHEAGAMGCRAVVLPECLDLGWTFPDARDRAQAIPGPYSFVLARAAREAGIYAAAGLTERDGSRVYNAAILLSPEGEIVLKHRKINELDIARAIYDTGDRLGVTRTPLGTIGIDICADNFPDSLDLARSLARMGAALLLSPCAWAVPADHDNEAEPYGSLWEGAYGTLCREYPMTVAGASNVGPVAAGPWAGRKCIGCSLAVGPGGVVLAKGPYGETAEALIRVETPARAGASHKVSTPASMRAID